MLTTEKVSRDEWLKIVPRKPETGLLPMKIAQLLAYQLPLMEEYLLFKKDFVQTKEQYDMLFLETKKYLALCVLKTERVNMYSRTVDEMWHSFILYTEQYADFCDEFCGKFMHHAPCTPEQLQTEDLTGFAEFVALYESYFGEIHPIWMHDSVELMAARCSRLPNCRCNCGCT